MHQHGSRVLRPGGALVTCYLLLTVTHSRGDEGRCRSDEQRLDRINNIRGQLPYVEDSEKLAQLHGEMSMLEGIMHRKKQVRRQ